MQSREHWTPLSSARPVCTENWIRLDATQKPLGPRGSAQGRPGPVRGAQGAFPVPAFGEEPTHLSFQLDLAFDLVRQADAGERDRARGRESLVALERALRQGLADGLLDLALRAHPQPFEKFADAAVEDVFVHDRLLCGA